MSKPIVMKEVWIGGGGNHGIIWPLGLDRLPTPVVGDPGSAGIGGGSGGISDGFGCGDDGGGTFE